MRHGVIRLMVVCLAAAVSQCSYDEVVTASYASHSEARQSGAIERGWIPEWMPASAEGIREAHDQDTNRRWGLFDFAPADAGSIRSILAPQPMSLEGMQGDMPSRVEWWPVILRGRLDPARIKDAGLEAYRTKTDNLVVVLNWKQGRAYYWKGS